MVTTTMKTGSPLSLGLAVPDCDKQHTPGAGRVLIRVRRFRSRNRAYAAVNHAGLLRGRPTWFWLALSASPGTPRRRVRRQHRDRRPHQRALHRRPRRTIRRARPRGVHHLGARPRPPGPPGQGRDQAVARYQGDPPADAGQAPGPSHEQRRLVRHFLRRRRGHDCGPRYGPGHYQRHRRHPRPLPGRRNWHRSGSTLSPQTSSRPALGTTSARRARRTTSQSSAAATQPGGSALDDIAQNVLFARPAASLAARCRTSMAASR
jgi:hypothetical protein